MKLAYTQSYPDSPQRVVELLHNPEFLDDIATHAGALEHSTDITAEQIRLAMKLPVPSHLTRFVGDFLQLHQTFRFFPAASDGTITGSVEADVPGMPVEVKASAVLAPRNEATLAQYTGELVVRIPLLGRKVEQQVEPFIRDAFDGLERRAVHWLSRA